MSSCHIRIACHGKAASPVVGRAVYAFIPEVSFSCPLILLRWQIRLTCKASPCQKKKKEKNRCMRAVGYLFHSLACCRGLSFFFFPFFFGFLRKKPYMSALFAIAAISADS